MATLPIPQAVAWKYPGSRCSKNADGDGLDSWVPPPDRQYLQKPNRIELLQILREYDDHLKATAYKTKRAAEYPALGDQLDAIWKAMVSLAAGDPVPQDVRNMISAIAAVKERHPAP